MHAHAWDLRVEIQKDWEGLVDSKPAASMDKIAFDDFVHQIVDDWRQCPLRPGVRRLLEYAEKLTHSLSEASEADVAALRKAGWSDDAVHDAVQVVAYFNYINRVADGLGIDPEDGLKPWGKTPF